MLIVPIILTNLDLVTALNDGVTPEVKLNDKGGVTPTYLVIKTGEDNRIITDAELDELRKTKNVKTTERRFLYAR